MMRMCRFAFRRSPLVVTALLVAVLMCSRDASAEGLLTGFVGPTFGGDTESSAATYGAAIGATAGGIFGFEFDVATTANLFGDDPVVDDGSVTTAMGNILLGVGGPVRPYATAGVGLIRSSIDTVGGTTVDTNDFGVNVGGGVMAFFSDHVGIRGDVRFYRLLSGDDDDELFDFDFELGDLQFWRGTVGVVLRW